MPDVRITNPEVRIDLKNNETTTVPTGERWIVDILTIGQNTTKILNPAGESVMRFADTRLTRVPLSGGDSVKAMPDTRTAIRGEVVST